MKFLLLFAMDESSLPQPGTPEADRYFGDFFQFNSEIHGAGVWQAGQPLMPAATATTVQVQDGEVLATDGPFAETKEQVGGYMEIECADLHEALAWAARVPSAVHGYGPVEVRQIWDVQM